MATKTKNAQDNTHGQEIKVPCEVYSRIVGYLRPVQAWNAAKQQEFSERATFDKAIEDARNEALQE